MADEERGVAAFVLHYRVAPYRYPAPIADAQRAVRLLRGQAASLGFAPDHLGAWGFSAGGHLASVLATLFDDGIVSSPDPVEHASDRPNFVILAYPVISMKPELAHAGSRQHLLGAMPDPAFAALLSSEDHVTPMSPPAFLFTTDDDPVVPSRNSVLYAAACQRAGVPVELHMFEHGPHGVDLANDKPTLHVWTMLLENWMRENQWIAPAALYAASTNGANGETANQASGEGHDEAQRHHRQQDRRETGVLAEKAKTRGPSKKPGITDPDSSGDASAGRHLRHAACRAIDDR